MGRWKCGLTPSRAWQLIEEQDASGFTAYLGKHRNTICGRHPISVRGNYIMHH
jgi:predicted class III extradiol MEMO1 family dioxygenase